MGQSLRRARSLSLSLPFVCLFLSVLLKRDAETIIMRIPHLTGCTALQPLKYHLVQRDLKHVIWVLPYFKRRRN